MRMRCWQAQPIATRVGGAYLLVVSNEDEVMAGSAYSDTCGRGLPADGLQ